MHKWVVIVSYSLKNFFTVTISSQNTRMDICNPGHLVSLGLQTADSKFARSLSSEIIFLSINCGLKINE